MADKIFERDLAGLGIAVMKERQQLEYSEVQTERLFSSDQDTLL